MNVASHLLKTSVLTLKITCAVPCCRTAITLCGFLESAAAAPLSRPRSRPSCLLLILNFPCHGCRSTPRRARPLHISGFRRDVARRGGNDCRLTVARRRRCPGGGPAVPWRCARAAPNERDSRGPNRMGVRGHCATPRSSAQPDGIPGCRVRLRPGSFAGRVTRAASCKRHSGGEQGNALRIGSPGWSYQLCSLRKRRIVHGTQYTNWSLHLGML